MTTSAYLGCESALFWHDLSDAGLIEGSYMGTDAPVTITAGQADNTYIPDAKVGVQASVIAFSLSAPVQMSAPSIPPTTNSCGVGSICYTIAGMYNGVGGITAGSLAAAQARNVGLTPLEAFAIDSKIDDGFPMTGSVYGGNVTLSVCGGSCSPVEILASTTNPDLCVTWDTYPSPTNILYAVNTAFNIRTHQNNQPNVPSCLLNISGQ